jgi:hypothetical protein
VAAVFFSIACCLSTVFNDMWRPVLITIGISAALSAVDQILREWSLHAVYGVMSGETYFRTGSLPWLGLLVSAGASAALLFGASMVVTRQDF